LGESSEVSQVIRVLLMNSSLSESETHQIAAHLNRLLDQADENSQLSETMLFSTFVRFFVRFESVLNLMATVYEFSEIIDSGTEYLFDYQARFKSWLSPTTDKTAAMEVLRTEMGRQAWAVIPSKTPNMFTVFHKDENEQISALYIIHAFAVKFRSGELTDQPTLDGILTRTLGLTYGHGAKMPQQSRPKYVDADEIIRKNRQREKLPEQLQLLMEFTGFGSPVTLDLTKFLAADSPFQCSQIEGLSTLFPTRKQSTPFHNQRIPDIVTRPVKAGYDKK
jgi:hypothetical protein